MLIISQMKLELHISRRENGKREMATGKFPGGKWAFSREISRFDQIWPKTGKNDQNLSIFINFLPSLTMKGLVICLASLISAAELDKKAGDP